MKREVGDEMPCLGSGWLCDNHSQGVCTCKQVYEHLDAETTRALEAEARVAELDKEIERLRALNDWLIKRGGQR